MDNTGQILDLHCGNMIQLEMKEKLAKAVMFVMVPLVCSCIIANKNELRKKRVVLTDKRLRTDGYYYTIEQASGKPAVSFVLPVVLYENGSLANFETVIKPRPNTLEAFETFVAKESRLGSNKYVWGYYAFRNDSIFINRFIPWNTNGFLARLEIVEESGPLTSDSSFAITRRRFDKEATSLNRHYIFKKAMLKLESKNWIER